MAVYTWSTGRSLSAVLAGRPPKVTLSRIMSLKNVISIFLFWQRDSKLTLNSLERWRTVSSWLIRSQRDLGKCQPMANGSSADHCCCVAFSTGVLGSWPSRILPACTRSATIQSTCLTTRRYPPEIEGGGSVEPFAVVCILTTIIVKVLREKFVVLRCVGRSQASYSEDRDTCKCDCSCEYFCINTRLLKYFCLTLGSSWSPGDN